MAELTVQILARDEAATLRAAIASARKLNAEVVVGVDTASVDETRELAIELANQVIDIDFMGDCSGSFAEAHNRLAALGSGTWRMKLDGHETLAEGAADPILSTLSQNSEGGGLARHCAETAHDRGRRRCSGHGAQAMAPRPRSPLGSPSA